MKLSSKRWRSRAQIAADKLQEDKEKQAVALQKQEIAVLKEQITEMNERMNAAANLHEQVQVLVNDGVIK